MARQVFTKAFKLEAVRLLDASKQPASAIARELRIKRENLDRKNKHHTVPPLKRWFCPSKRPCPPVWWVSGWCAA
jgi:hypothetical protein